MSEQNPPDSERIAQAERQRREAEALAARMQARNYRLEAELKAARMLVDGRPDDDDDVPAGIRHALEMPSGCGRQTVRKLEIDDRTIKSVVLIPEGTVDPARDQRVWWAIQQRVRQGVSAMRCEPCRETLDPAVASLNIADDSDRDDHIIVNIDDPKPGEAYRKAKRAWLVPASLACLDWLHDHCRTAVAGVALASTGSMIIAAAPPHLTTPVLPHQAELATPTGPPPSPDAPKTIIPTPARPISDPPPTPRPTASITLSPTSTPRATASPTAAASEDAPMSQPDADSSTPPKPRPSTRPTQKPKLPPAARQPDKPSPSPVGDG